MQIIRKTKNGWVLRIDRGDEAITELKAFCENQKINGAWFWGLGAADDLELAFYDLTKKQYLKKRFRGGYEILQLHGNIAHKRKEIIVHAHGIFSDRSSKIIGGHVFRCRISATCEIYLGALPALRRTHDSRTGLNLLPR